MLNQPEERWPPADEKQVIAEMLSDPGSPQWGKCQNVIERLVYKQARDFSNEVKEDIVEDVLLSVVENVAKFQFKCKLTTWLGAIIRNRVASEWRKQRREEYLLPHPRLDDTQNDTENEEDTWISPQSTEDICIRREEWYEIVSVLEEYIKTHANQDRNREILHLVIFAGQSNEQTAIQLGVSAPVVGYIVRSAQRFIRERLGYHLLPHKPAH